MIAALTEAQRDLLRIRLRATAALNMQLAAALLGKDQDPLRKHFLSNAELLSEAHAALEARNG